MKKKYLLLGIFLLVSAFAVAGVRGIVYNADVNGDGATDVADYAAVWGVMADEYDAFSDVNLDGTVNVADMAAVITEMCKTDSVTGNPNGKAVLTVERYNIIENDSTIELVVNIDYETTESVSGWAFSLYLPEGIAFNSKYNKAYTLSDETHPWRLDWSTLESINPEKWLKVSKKDDGGYLFMWFDRGEKTPLVSTHGQLLTIHLAATGKVRGVGKIMGISLASSNYASLEIDNIADAEFGFNVQEEQTLDFAEIPTQTYGDTYALPSTTNEGQTLTWTVANSAIASVSNGTLNALKAGTTIVTATQAGNENYKPFSREFTLTVNKAALTITANDASKTYGDANPTFSVSYSGFVNGDDATKLTTQPTISTTATTSSAAGTYAITASGAASDNYDITYVAGTLTVTKASQSMALTSIPAQTYGAAAYTLPATTAQGQTLTWTVAKTSVATVSGNTLTIKKAGTTTVTATQAGGTNYESFSKEFTLTVSKAALTVTANDASKTYGDANPTLSVSYSGFVNGDNAAKLTTQPTVATTATVDSPAGTYPITVSGAASTNYTFTYKAGTLTVGKAALTITADDKTRDVADENPELTVSYSGFKNGDDASSLTTQPTVTTTATKDSPVGIYPITVSGAASGNYTFNYVAGTLTVTEAPTEIVVTDISQIDNAIYIEPFSALVGGDVNIEICLKNADAATAYVFDLVLPEGITVALNDKGKYIDALSDRHDDHTRTFNYKGDNTYSLSTLSGNSEELTGNDGAIRLLTLSVADDVAEGVYAVEIKNASYSKPDGTLVTLPNTTTSITVEDYVLGDVNGNGGVDIGDAVSIVNYLVGKESSTFVAKAADTNKNGQVDIGDAVTIVNFLVGKTESLSRQATVWDEKEPQ